ncbi:hypothetical protein ACHAQH_004888 [Verticillium albo-atrum]
MADHYHSGGASEGPPEINKLIGTPKKEDVPFDYGKPVPYPTRDQKEQRKRVWVRPAHMSEEERKRIIADYEADFQDFKKDEEGMGEGEEQTKVPSNDDEKSLDEGKKWSDEDEESGLGKATKRVHFLRADLAAGPSPEEKALERKQRFEKQTGEKVSDEDWFAIWSHETANDGMIERLRRWAAGRDSVPVGFFNSFIQKTYAATYDAIAEEDRLRAQKLIMQTNYDARLEQDQKDYEIRLAHSHADAKATAEVEVITRMIHGMLDQISEEPKQPYGSAPEAFKEAYADAQKALADRTRAEEAVDETTSRHIPPSAHMMIEKDERLRAAIDRLREQLANQTSNAASLCRLVDALMASSGERQVSRKTLFDTKERLQREADERVRNAHRVQNFGFQHFIKLEQQLHDANMMVGQLNGEVRKRNDEYKNLVSAVHSPEHSMLLQAITKRDRYGELVAQRVRGGLSEQSDAVLSEANKLQESISSFENLSLLLKNMSPPLPATVAPSIYDELARMSSLFEGAPDSLRGLASGLLDHALDKESKVTERLAEADAEATLLLLKDEVKRLEGDKRRLEASMLSIKDTTDISAALDAQGADRERADKCQREALELHEKLRESRQREKAAAREVQTRIDALQRSLDRAQAPVKGLERQAEQAREERRTAELRAEIAEAKVRDITATLDSVSDDFMKLVTNPEKMTTAPAEEAKCASEDHRGQIERLTGDSERLQAEKEGAVSSASFATRRALENENQLKTLAIERAEAELAEVREAMEVQVVARVEAKTAGLWDEFAKSGVLDESRGEDVPGSEVELQAALHACRRREEAMEETRNALEKTLDAYKMFNTKLLDGNCELRKLQSEGDQAYAKLQLPRADDPLSGAEFRDRLTELQEEVFTMLRRRKDDHGEPSAETMWGEGKRQSVVRIQQVFAGRPSADQTAAGLMSSAQIEAYWKYLFFQRQRAQVISALKHGNWRAALTRLDALDLWFEGAGEWHRFYMESEIQGSLAHLRAFCLAKTAGDMLKRGDAGWTAMRDKAKQELRRASRLRGVDSVGEDKDEDDEDEDQDEDASEDEKKYAQVWRDLGRRAQEDMDALEVEDGGRDGKEHLDPDGE